MKIHCSLRKRSQLTSWLTPQELHALNKCIFASTHQTSTRKKNPQEPEPRRDPPRHLARERVGVGRGGPDCCLLEKLSEGRKLTTAYLAKNAHRWVTSISLKATFLMKSSFSRRFNDAAEDGPTASRRRIAPAPPRGELISVEVPQTLGTRILKSVRSYLYRLVHFVRICLH